MRATTPAELASGGGGLAAMDARVALGALRSHAAEPTEAVRAAAQFGQRACARWLARNSTDGAAAAAALHCAALCGGPTALKTEGRRLLGAAPEAAALWSAYAAVQRAHADALLPTDGAALAEKSASDKAADKASRSALGWAKTLEQAAALLAPAAASAATAGAEAVEVLQARLELASDCALAAVELGAAGNLKPWRARAARALVDALGVEDNKAAPPSAAVVARAAAECARQLRRQLRELASAVVVDGDVRDAAADTASAEADAARVRTAAGDAAAGAADVFSKEAARCAEIAAEARAF
ncbi:hypothetical protein T492DRAFT_12597 [Pavlovales sp. CCMP2436]|nr:hypothetical protein T492DRAFT_12597 [Pavlovales sp. CCMP2436]